MHDFFTLNRPLVLFIYGQTFFVMGLAIFLQSRRHSRLRLARDLRWLAAFGVLHGIHEWGDVFIPIQAVYLPRPYVELLLTLQVLILALSFVCLMVFGAVVLDSRWKYGLRIVIGIAVVWGFFFWLTLYTTPTFTDWYRLSATWARYLPGLFGSLLSAYGLRYQAEMNIKPLGDMRIYRTLRIAGVTLVAYAILGGLIVRPANFFPANLLNTDTIESLFSVPIEVFRSTIGLIMAFSVIRALEVFDIEVDRLIENMEVESVQATERDRIGQEIHDGAIQGVYSASLILESMQHYIKDNPEAIIRWERTKRVMSGVIIDLRRYMVSLRTDVPAESLIVGIQRMANDPRFSSLLSIQVRAEFEPDLKPIQIGHIWAIVQECLSNAVRHAHARHVTIHVLREQQGLIVRIEDDGQGFEEQSISAGYGLRSIKDRARLLGGQFAIKSRVGKGTIITLVLSEENGQ